MVKFTIGELNTKALDDIGENAAAIHGKCLICDKPSIIAGSHRARRSAGKSRPPIPGTRGSGHYDKADDMISPTRTPLDSREGSRPNSTPNVDLLPPTHPRSPERAKIISEIAVIRSSIEPLPELTVSFYFLH